MHKSPLFLQRRRRVVTRGVNEDGRWHVMEILVVFTGDKRFIVVLVRIPGGICELRCAMLRDIDDRGSAVCGLWCVLTLSICDDS